MKELLLLLPDCVKNYFFPGIAIGLAAWIISSLILGPIVGYGTGALLGQLVGGFAVGIYAGRRISAERIYSHASWIGIVTFSGIYFSGSTLMLKSFVDERLGSVDDGHFALAYIVAFAVTSMIVAGFAECLIKTKLKAEPDA